MGKNYQNFIIIFLLGAVTFHNSIFSDFLAYDDLQNIVNNTYIAENNILHFWKNSYFGLYIPVTYTFWSLLNYVFGLSSSVFHAANVIFHICNSFLVFLILRNFKFNSKLSLLSCLIFLLHPIQVEPVMWVTGLKDVLSAFFGLFSIYLFSSSSIKWKLKGFLVLFLLCLASLTKPTAGAISFALLSFSFYIHYKNNGKLVGIFTGYWYLLVASAFSASNLLGAKFLQNTKESSLLPNFFERIIISLDSFGFYVKKIVLPVSFFPDYGRTSEIVLKDWNFFANSIVSIFCFCAAVYVFRKMRGEDTKRLYLIMFFIGILQFLPISGIISFDYQKISNVADRYMYFVMLPVCFLFASIIQYFSQKNARLTGIAAFFILMTLTMLSTVQTYSWTNNRVFFNSMYEGNPESFNANNNLGVISLIDQDYENAERFFFNAKKIRPFDLTPIASLISLYDKQKKWDKLEALAKQYLPQNTIRNYVRHSIPTGIALKTYANYLISMNKREEAFEYLCRAGTYSKIIMQQVTPLVIDLQNLLNRRCADVPVD